MIRILFVNCSTLGLSSISPLTEYTITSAGSSSMSGSRDLMNSSRKFFSVSLETETSSSSQPFAYGVPWISMWGWMIHSWMISRTFSLSGKVNARISADF